MLYDFLTLLAAIAALAFGAWAWYRSTTWLEARGRYYGDWLSHGRPPPRK